jgi:glycogen(starch) synthase
MKVAMIGWEYPPFKVGGLGTHCYGLTRSLADIDVKIDFFMPNTKTHSKSDKKNLKIIKVGTTSVFPYDRPEEKEIGGNFFEAVEEYNNLVYSKINKDGYDLIHCHDWLTMNAAIKAKHNLNVPLILTIHSTEYDRSGWLNPNQWFIDIEKKGMDEADRIIAVSHFTKKTLIDRYHIDPEKIRVVHNAVYPISEKNKQKIVLYLGRLTIQKGPLYFLRAAKKVLDYENCQFILAGSGDMDQELIEESIRLGISNKVIFTGRISEKEVEYLYGIASVYVLPSVSEPFGITALEAISAGTPAILSTTAGVSEVFNNALKVDFWDTDEMANEIISILRYEPLRKTLSVNGKNEIKLFTWDLVARRTKDVYREVFP